tara:strand:+ start:497 stop:1399 length:903 start_codon:yes stop_codon:yes gene_type:complete
LKKKFVFLGDVNSINIEIIYKSHKNLKNKVNYIMIGNINDLSKYLKKIDSKLKVNEIYDPIKFSNFNKNHLNIFNIENISNEKYKNLLNQIEIANRLSIISKNDLVTMPINKSIFKKKINFNGMTEYLAKINKKDTHMLMYGEKFSVIPLTTHINLNDVSKFIDRKFIKPSIQKILFQLKRSIYNFKYNNIKFLCYNPHCGEDNTIGNQDRIVYQSISRFKKIKGPYAADSAFKNLNSKLLFISMYHDQVLIPFKLLNKKGINITLGLNYKRLSPAHGTATDIIFKNKVDLSSYLSCMEH